MSTGSKARCDSVSVTNRTSHFRLTPKARDELEEIWSYSAQTWSINQADRYIDSLVEILNTIAALPEIARERVEYQPPVRIHVHAQHLIIYRIEVNFVLVIRILGGNQDWRAILGQTEL